MATLLAHALKGSITDTRCGERAQRRGGAGKQEEEGDETAEFVAGSPAGAQKSTRTLAHAPLSLT